MRLLKNSEDYFNEKQTRNEENTEKKDYNCGGYALKTFSWYLPYEYDEKDYPFFSYQHSPHSTNDRYVHPIDSHGIFPDYPTILY